MTIEDYRRAVDRSKSMRCFVCARNVPFHYEGWCLTCILEGGES